MAGIYVHVPFCRQKCRYCDFASFPDKIGLAESYMACVYREMAMREGQLKGYLFDTLYIGGGTPSVIDENYIAMLVAAARKHFSLAPDAEITIEMNPGTVSASKIDMYKRSGINRFSVGLQTANDKLLADLGRIHTLKDYLSCAKLLKGQNFSADIMIYRGLSRLRRRAAQAIYPCTRSRPKTERPYIPITSTANCPIPTRWPNNTHSVWRSLKSADLSGTKFPTSAKREGRAATT